MLEYFERDFERRTLLVNLSFSIFQTLFVKLPIKCPNKKLLLLRTASNLKYTAHNKSDATLLRTVRLSFFISRYLCHLIVSYAFVSTAKPKISLDRQVGANSVTLTCTATGNPTPRVAWHTRNEQGDFVPLEEWSTHTSVIKIEKSEDSHGAYWCVANNTEGHDMAQLCKYMS